MFHTQHWKWKKKKKREKNAYKQSIAKREETKKKRRTKSNISRECHVRDIHLSMPSILSHVSKRLGCLGHTLREARREDVLVAPFRLRLPAHRVDHEAAWLRVPSIGEVSKGKEKRRVTNTQKKERTNVMWCHEYVHAMMITERQ